MADPKQREDERAGASASRSGRGARKGAESIGYLVLVGVVLILANVAGYYINGRVDLTESRRYSLSQGSERLVGDLDEEMTITAFFTSDLPPPFNATERYVRNLLEEYESAGGGQVHVRVIDPDEEEERDEAQRLGVREVQHQAIENDSVSVRTGYRGLVIEYRGDRKAIPVIQDTQGLEYEITQKIRELVRPPLPVGIASGHGSPTPSEGLSTLRGALPHYELQPTDVSQEIDQELRALLIVNPTERFSDAELRRINQYVMRGGSLGIFGGTMNVTLEGMPSAQSVDTGINQLLERWGVRMGDALVADARCGRVPMRSAIGIPIPVAYPPAPIVVFDEEAREHPVLFRLNQAPFFFSSPIETANAFDELRGQVLGQSSEEASWLLSGERIQLQPRDPREWTISGESGPHTVLVALSGQLPSAFAGAAAMSTGGEEEASDITAPERAEREVRVLVSGSGAILRDQFLPSQEQSRGQMTSGLAFVLNAVDWLAADADLIAIRAKNIEDPALDVPQHVQTAEQEIREAAQTGDEGEVEAAIARHQEAMDSWEAKKTTYRAVAIGGPPLLVLLFGLIRWQMRKNKRANLMELRKKLTAGRA